HLAPELGPDLPSTGDYALHPYYRVRACRRSAACRLASLTEAAMHRHAHSKHADETVVASFRAARRPASRGTNACGGKRPAARRARRWQGAPCPLTSSSRFARPCPQPTSYASFRGEGQLGCCILLCAAATSRLWRLVQPERHDRRAQDPAVWYARSCHPLAKTAARSMCSSTIVDRMLTGGLSIFPKPPLEWSA